MFNSSTQVRGTKINNKKGKKGKGSSKTKGRNVVSDNLSSEIKDSIILQNDKEITSNEGINDSKKEIERLEYLQKSEEKIKQECINDLATLKNKLNDNTLDSKEKFAAMRDRLKREQQIERDESYINQEMMIDSRIDDIEANKEILQEDLNIHNQIEELDKRRIFKDLTESECREKMAQLAEQRKKLQDNIKNGKLDGMNEEELEVMLVELESYEEALDNDILIHEQKHEYEKELENPYLTKEECEQGIMQCEQEIMECEQEKVNLAEEYENIPTSYDDKINKLEEGIKLYNNIEIRDKNIREYESQKQMPQIQNNIKDKLGDIISEKEISKLSDMVKLENLKEFYDKLEDIKKNKNDIVGYIDSDKVIHLLNNNKNIPQKMARASSQQLANNNKRPIRMYYRVSRYNRATNFLDKMFEKFNNFVTNVFMEDFISKKPEKPEKSEKSENPESSDPKNDKLVNDVGDIFGQKNLAKAHLQNKPEILKDEIEKTFRVSWENFTKILDDAFNEESEEARKKAREKLVYYTTVFKALNNNKK